MTKQRISFGSQYKFPLKLYQVVNDGLLLKWTEDGMAVVVEQKEFEENVMQFYPGFVQVKTFHNLRRLFRDYAFRFQMLRRKKPHGLKLEFRHEFFTRNNPHQVLLVRKSKRRYSMHPLATSSPKNSMIMVNTASSKLTVTHFEGFDNSGNISCVRDELDSCRQLLPECNPTSSNQNVKEFRSNNTTCHLDQFNFRKRLTSCTVEGGPENVCLTDATAKFGTRSNKLTQDDLNNLEQIFAKNELSESEFWEVVTRKRGLEWLDKSWNATIQLLNSVMDPELSPLHHNGFYYEFSLDEL